MAIWPGRDDRAAEVASRVSEETYRLTFENAAVGIAEVGLDGRFLRANDKLCEITGYTREELLERTFQDITHPDDLDEDLTQVARLEAGAVQTYTMEKRYLRRDGTPIYVNLSASAVRSLDGRIHHFVAIVEDITVRRTAEDALRRSEHRFRSVFEHAATGIAITDIEGRYTQCNPAYERIVGYAEAELQGRTFSSLMHPDDLPENAAALARLMAGELPHYEVENRYLHKSGREVWVRKFVSLLYEDASAPSHFMALVTDITDERAALAAQHEAMRQKDEFLAVLAHELRNPLAPIRTSVAVLRQMGPSDPVLARCRDVIDRQAAHMARLVDDLLDVSRLSRGQLRLQRAPADLRAIVEAAVELTQPLFEAEHQRLVVEGCDQPIVLEADAARLTQVLGNLLNNASKYSARGGEVTLAVAREADGVVLRVTDHGVGIAPGQLDTVFDLFAQADAGRLAGKGGLGIGLALARQLVGMHRGTIGVQSEGPGRGSTFSVWLPVTPGSPAPDVAAAAAAGGRLSPLHRSRRVLVADDNVDGVDMMALLFRELGCEVRATRDGEAAVREAEAFRPDLAVLDIGMPGMDGLEACRRIRQQPWGRSVLMVAVTGWGQDDDRRRSAEAGFDRHLVKPVEPATLAHLLEEVERKPPS